MNYKTKMLLTITALVMFAATLVGQGTLTGIVKDASTGEALIGTTIALKGTATGTTTGIDGKFKLQAPAGSQTLVISFIGYDRREIEASVQNGQTANLGTIRLQPSAIGLGGINIIADRARERETPVAFSTMTKKEIEEQLGSRDIPMVMNMTPSVYATQQGGGAGDARINVRGFNQQNVAIMINGVPVNDMENGWVYWSNWDGVGDATSSIQMQRGLSAVNLATPSIGGTMNVITNPAENKAGVTYKQEFGSGRFLKSTLFGHTGLIDGKYALSAGVVRKTGDGVIDGTWTDAMAYYLGASWNINSKNRLELYAIGAPQRHGQNSYKQNIASYDSNFAKDIDGYDVEAIEKYPQSVSGRYYNQTWSPVTYLYDGKQSWNGKEHDRHDKNFINERENYYHKPLVNLNWFTQWNEKLSQYTVVYYSGGQGGGSGTLGSMKWNYGGPSRIVDYDATIANNSKSDTAFGILRNSTNNQWTIGAISKLNYTINDNLKASIGVDWRTAEIAHYREVRDLLGGKYFIFTGNQFDDPADYKKGLGDKIGYDFTNTVDWIGGYAQAEYSTDNLTVYGMAGYSTIKYNYVNHFRKGEDGNELTTETDPIGGYQVKGGASYNVNENFGFFANVGVVSKVPIFDAVIDDVGGTKAEDPQNEMFTAIEFGAYANLLDDNFTLKANYYNTSWKDRTNRRSVINEDGSEGIVFLTGLNQLHTGIEIEAAYTPCDFARIDVAASFGNWTYTDDVTGVYKTYTDDGSADIEYNYYVKDLKVGDAPQTQIAAALSLYPVKNARIQFVARMYDNNYSDFSPFSRTDPEDLVESWMAPGYTVFDLHASYTLPLEGKTSIQLFGHVFNLFDAIYIQDAVDNSRFNAFNLDHTADDAEVFLGLPRIVNFGFVVNL
jgi:hypothetical protein